MNLSKLTESPISISNLFMRKIRNKFTEFVFLCQNFKKLMKEIDS